MDINITWEKSYEVLKNDFLKRDVNDFLLPLFLICSVQWIRNLGDLYNTFLKWDISSKSYNRYVLHKVKKELLDIFITPNSKYDELGMLNTENPNLSIDIKTHYDYIKKYKLFSIIDGELNYSNLYSFDECLEYLISNNKLSDIVNYINEYLNKIEPSEFINELMSFKSYQNYQQGHLEIRRMTDNSDSITWRIVNPYPYRPGKSKDIPDIICLWSFNEGFARFIDKNGMWGFIKEDDYSRITLPRSILRVYDFSCGRARFETEVGSDNKFGYLDYKMNIVIKPQFDSATDFINNTAKVKQDYSLTEYEIDPNNKVSKDDVNKLATEKILFDSISGLGNETHQSRPKTECYDDEESVMRVLSKGCGDFLGYK